MRIRAYNVLFLRIFIYGVFTRTGVPHFHRLLNLRAELQGSWVDLGVCRVILSGGMRVMGRGVSALPATPGTV